MAASKRRKVTDEEIESLKRDLETESTPRALKHALDAVEGLHLTEMQSAQALAMLTWVLEAQITEHHEIARLRLAALLMALGRSLGTKMTAARKRKAN